MRNLFIRLVRTAAAGPVSYSNSQILFSRFSFFLISPFATSSLKEEPTAEPFKVPNSDRYTPTHVEGLCLPLYERQARALTRMLDIESGKVKFNEEEYAEEVLPGVGWSLIGRASRTSTLRGGVLGDAIGSGKTVITIALILADIENARKDRDVKRGISGATQ